MNNRTITNPYATMRELLFAILLLMLSPSAWAFEPFMIEEIQVEGLQRISTGTVFNYLPLKQGDRVDEQASSGAIRALFGTGFFKDVRLDREGGTLRVIVAERPAIASIKIEGNEEIPSEQLLESLKQDGFAEGRVFNRSMLDKIEQVLKRQYLSLGKYNVHVGSTVTALERNRVDIKLDIIEGAVASIYDINIVANRAFTEEQLLDKFELGTKPVFSLFSDRDQYSKQKLSADLETLRSYYLDRGYINFNIESTQVSITPDKRQVYITITLFEGERYRVSEVTISGNTIVPMAQLRELIGLKTGDIFSRKEIAESSSRLGERLGDEGYAFANINPIPEIDEEKREVALNFFVDPGKRVYVRRINISGNTQTKDEVIRREMRQLEGEWLSTAKVKRSRTRLNRLGFFESVSLETPLVAGSSDQVDVDFDLVERDTFGTFSVGAGYGDSGFLVNASVNWENFLGSGKRLDLSFDNSKVNTVYNFRLTNPYYTLDGVSRSFNIFFRETDASEANVADYTTDNYGAGMTFGIPLSEDNRVRFGLNYTHTRLTTTANTSQQILDFCAQNAVTAACEFNTYKLTNSWIHDTRNKTIFPDSGSQQSLGMEIAVPGGDDSLSFYKLRYNNRHYLPLSKSLTFSPNLDIAYANSYGDSTVLPPFERYYAGGTRTVRGYRANSLGATGTRDAGGKPLGGNARVVANLELIFPSPFSENSGSTRVMAFVDGGNVFDTTQELDLGEVRYSAGLALKWITPIGALNFNLSTALNATAEDVTEGFQFSLGMPF